MWKETTDPKDPLTRDGEWSLALPWLKSNHMPSRYTVRNDRGYFITCFWHGNQGHDFDGHFHYLDQRTAMNACKVHLHDMKIGIDAMLNQL